MANGIRTSDPRRFNKGRSLKFQKGSRVRQTPEEGRRTYRPKRCGNNDNNKDEDSCAKTLYDKNDDDDDDICKQDLAWNNLWGSICYKPNDQPT